MLTYKSRLRALLGSRLALAARTTDALGPFFNGLLGPEHWPAIEPQFFSKKALRTRAGREEASAILHTITTLVLHGGAKAWKKERAFVALVDSLANAEGESLARTAESLRLVLRGKKPLS